jgi:hypothetical protein
MKRTTFTVLAGIGFFVWTLAVVLHSHTTRAQTAPSVAPGELLMTWHANTYVPPAFVGKALPVPLSAVTVSVEAIHSGRVASLAGETVRWYVGGRLMASGTGMQSFSFSIPQNAVAPFEVRVELPDATVEPTLKTITIPFVRPRAVIVSPFPDDTVRNSSVSLRAVPYFFNVTTARDLLFSWTVNDAATDTTENPDQLDLSFGGSGSAEASVAVTIRNPLMTAEGAKATLDLTVAP